MFCPSAWPRTPNERPRDGPNAYFGDATTFVFSLLPHCAVHSATGRQPNYFRCDGESGISIGGDRLLPAIAVSTDLASGRCLSSHTFGDTRGLASSTDELAFGLVQLWDLTPPDDDEAAAGKDEIEKTSVLNTRRVDAMMLPFRTSVMMRVQ